MINTTIGQNGKRAQFEVIDAIKSREYLKNNNYNRNASETYINRFTSLMLKDQWLDNGTVIKFDSNNTLIDGQKRLFAISKSEKPCECLVIRGIQPMQNGLRANSAEDCGQQRAIVDQWQMDKTPNANKLFTGVNLISYLIRTFNVRLEMTQANFIKSIFNDDLQLIIEKTNKNKCFAKGIVFALGALIRHVDQTRFDEYFEQLMSGINITEGSPVGYFRQKMLAREVSFAGTDNVRNAFEIMAQSFIKWRNQELVNKQLKASKDYKYVNEVIGLQPMEELNAIRENLGIKTK